MFQAWRWKVRQAELACEAGRLDEACRALADDDLRKFEPAQRLVTRLTSRLLDRVKQRISYGDWLGAWRDLDQARTLAGETSDLLAARQQLLQFEKGARVPVERVPVERMPVEQVPVEQVPVEQVQGEQVRLGPQGHGAPSDTAPTQWLPPLIRTGRDEPASRGGQEMTSGTRGDRMMLWIDGVGGFLVCTGKRVLIGQAIPDAMVDIAIQGDLSRRHAWICRDGEGYLIKALQTTRVAGRPVDGATSLADGDLIELGGTVRLRFRKPHALSGSACLELVSRHRTQPSAEGIVLMAESCVLGPQPSNHVICRAWSQDLVFYRRDEKLFCRSRKSFDINGQTCSGIGFVAGDSRIVGEDFSLSVEHLA